MHVNNAPLPELILSRLGELKEDDLSKTVIVPLLQRLGYDRVEYVGGPYEGGKDIICWRRDPLGQIEVGVIQVKKLKAMVSTRSEASFSDLINQLHQATEEEIPYVDGMKHVPSHAYFITPYAIDHRALLSRFKGYQNLRYRNVKILDGPELTQHLMAKAPDLVESLLGTHVVIQHSILDGLSNSILLDALKSHYSKNIASFYCDLDFVVGKVTHTHLMTRTWANQITPPHEITVGDLELSSLRTLDEEVISQLGQGILGTSHPEIETQRERYSNEFITELAKSNLNSNEVRYINKFYSKYRNKLTEVTALAETSWYAKCAKDDFAYNEITHDIYNIIKCVNELSETTISDWRSFKHKVDSAAARLKSVRPREKSKEYSSILSTVISIQTDIERSLSSYDKDYHPRFTVFINIEPLRQHIVSQLGHMKGEIARINSTPFTDSDLKLLLVTCRKLFQIIEKLTGCHQVNNELTIESKDEIDTDAFCLKIPINRLFDTGINLAIFGDAGAGKTTTLQMYAKRRAGTNRDQLVIFSALSGIGNGLTEDNAVNITKIDPLAAFEEALGAYVKSTMRYTLVELLSYYRGKTKVFILDGIDEAIKKAPWLLDGIRAFSEKYRDAQIIVSSRQSGEYINKVPFLGVTIRPFTDQQRALFIEHWFGEPDNSRVIQIKEHLKYHGEIAAIVRNPLLSTILCVLAEHDIPLPDREVRLYEQRRKLLLGDYDVQKGIHRVNVPDYLMQDIAERLAFEMHRSGKRYDSPAHLMEIALRYFSTRFDEATVTTAVRELFDPCNILVPMNSSGDWGFGHLRFQEYFVACEIEKNRSVNLEGLAKNSWWRGVFVLFAQKAREIDAVIEAIVLAPDLELALETLTAMIAVRADGEKPRLRKMIADARHQWRRHTLVDEIESDPVSDSLNNGNDNDDDNDGEFDDTDSQISVPDETDPEPREDEE